MKINHCSAGRSSSLSKLAVVIILSRLESFLILLSSWVAPKIKNSFCPRRTKTRKEEEKDQLKQENKTENKKTTHAKWKPESFFLFVPFVNSCILLILLFCPSLLFVFLLFYFLSIYLVFYIAIRGQGPHCYWSLNLRKACI